MTKKTWKKNARQAIQHLPKLRELIFVNFANSIFYKKITKYSSRAMESVRFVKTSSREN